MAYFTLCVCTDMTAVKFNNLHLDWKPSRKMSTVNSCISSVFMSCHKKTCWKLLSQKYISLCSMNFSSVLWTWTHTHILKSICIVYTLSSTFPFQLNVSGDKSSSSLSKLTSCSSGPDSSQTSCLPVIWWSWFDQLASSMESTSQTRREIWRQWKTLTVSLKVLLSLTDTSTRVGVCVCSSQPCM